MKAINTIIKNKVLGLVVMFIAFLNTGVAFANAEGGQQAQTSAESFTKFDPYGVAMTIIAMVVVFFALAVLYLLFKFMSRILNYKKDGANENVGGNAGASADEEVSAAIALALFMYRDELHDMENTVLTINKVAKAYSPWSSKIYGVTRWPRY